MSSSSWLLLLSCTLGMACKQEPFGNQPVRQRGVARPVELQPTAAPVEAKPFSPQLLPLRVDETPQAEEPAPADGTLPVAEAAPEAAEKPARDLRQELERMIGSPVDCLVPRPAKGAPAELRLSLNASVMPSGAVGRGEVSASAQLTKPELDCVRKRVEGLRFATPIDNAPVTVSGSVTLKYGT
jgi:hypothetical protein